MSEHDPRMTEPVIVCPNCKTEIKVFVVVTRQDSSWSNGRDGEEPHALAIVLSDRQQTNVKLYAEVRAAFEARIQARARARV